MKIEPERGREEALLEALLGDEEWQAVNTAIKDRALGTFRARQRVRRLARSSLSVAACAAALAGVVFWFASTAGLRQSAANHSEAPRRLSGPRYLTDEELLASFPKGSCFLAEVDGKKELIFPDPNVERIYLAGPERAIR